MVDYISTSNKKNIRNCYQINSIEKDRETNFLKYKRIKFQLNDEYNNTKQSLIKKE